MDKSKKIIFKILTGIFTLCFILLCAEIFLRAINYPYTKVGWKSHGLPKESNKLGFRGQEIKFKSNEFVILLLGDSQVESLATTKDQMPEQYLEKKLNQIIPEVKIKVFSLGAGGYGQDQQLLALEDYFNKYARADLVINWITFTNDIWNNTFPTHFGKTPKPTFLLRDKVLVYPTEKEGQYYPDTGILLFHFITRNITEKIYGRDQMWEAFLPSAGKQQLVPSDIAINEDWQVMWDKGYLREENLKNEKTHFSLYLQPVSKRTLYGLDLTRALFSEMQKICLKQKSQLMFFATDPLQNLDLNKEEYYSLNKVVYKTSNKTFRNNLDYLTKNFNFTFVTISEPNPFVSDHDSHLNSKGVCAVMNELANEIAKKIFQK